MTRYWVNDALVDAEHATVSVLDHGLTVGDGVFETVLVREGSPFAITRHLARLQRSLAGLGIAGPDPALIRRAVDAVVSSSGVATDFSRPSRRVRAPSGATAATSHRPSSSR